MMMKQQSKTDGKKERTRPPAEPMGVVDQISEFRNKENPGRHTCSFLSQKPASYVCICICVCIYIYTLVMTLNGCVFLFNSVC